MLKRSAPRRARKAAPPIRTVADVVESLEGRRMLSVVRPDHVVVVIEQDRASDAIGNSMFPYLNSVASTGLYYSNAHGVAHPSEPNSLAIFSGSTQGVTDNGRGYSFSGPNLARSLFGAGLSFAGYAENLPADGSQVTQAGDTQYPDLYTRNVNPMAQFTDYGTLPGGGARPNSAVNRTFGAFKAIPTTDYSALPTVSFVVPNNLHSTHGSNEAYPWAGSPDEQNNDLLRKSADDWLKANIDPYLQWAKTHNSLLVVTQDEERWVGGTSPTVTTLVNGDPRLFVPGTNTSSVNHYNVLRTIEEMYGLPLLNNTATAGPLATDAQGRLAPAASTTPAPAATTTALVSSANPSSTGQAVTFTATVSASAGGAAAPAGSVTFKDGATVLGTSALDANGKAILTTPALAAGPHDITAAYAGSAAFAASTSPVLRQVVDAPPSVAPTSTSLSSSLNPAAAGQPLTLTATVTSPAPASTAPGGLVTFRDGATVIGTVPVTPSGTASLVTNAFTVGSHTLTAAYGGDSAYSGSESAALALQVTSPAAAPANDMFADRIALSGTSATAYGTNIMATRQDGEPRHAGTNGGRSAWWTWTAPASGTVTIDTFGSNFDTLLAVYTGTRVRALTAVSSNNNAADGRTSRVTFTAVAGRAYQIAVDGFRGATGSVVLNVNLAASASAASDASVFSLQPIEPLSLERDATVAWA